MTIQEYIDIRDHLKHILTGTEFFEKVYCVGGCVRDYVRGVPPKDIDLVVELESGGIKLAEYLWKKRFLASPPVIYKNFGTTQFRLSKFPDHELESVQTRSEEYIDRSSRNPTTGYGSLDDDWKRRDFTINTLYHSLWKDNILDPSGKGIRDIKDKIIRTTSKADIIFFDDPLRILRAIRFSCTLGYSLDSDCLIGMTKNSFRLSIISKERVVSEVNKILMSPNTIRGLELLRETGSLVSISKYLQETTTLSQNKYHVGTVWEHTLEVISKLKGTDKITLWAALFHDIGKVNTKTIGEDGRVHFIGHAEEGEKLTRKILEDLHFSGGEIKKISELVLHHMDFKGNPRPKDKKLRKLQYLLGQTQYLRLWNLIEADNISHSKGYCIEGQRDYVLSRPMDMFEYKLPISGRDIMRVRGISEGPLVKKYLDHLMKLAYHNPGLTREDMLKRLRNLSPNKI